MASAESSRRIRNPLASTRCPSYGSGSGKTYINSKVAPPSGMLRVSASVSPVEASGSRVRIGWLPSVTIQVRSSRARQPTTCTMAKFGTASGPSAP